jgi:hypothetical protein
MMNGIWTRTNPTPHKFKNNQLSIEPENVPRIELKSMEKLLELIENDEKSMPESIENEAS